MKYKLLFIFIIFLGLAIRFYKVGSIPNGFYSDEAVFGYNAYSLMMTGADEYGVKLPISLKSFGDYKAALYAYYLVPFIAIGGLNQKSVRMGSVVLGAALIFLSYLVTFEVFKKRRIALTTALFLAVSPLMIQFERMQHENNLSFFLMLLGGYLFLKSLRKPLFFILSVLSFSLSVYSYHDAKILAPIIFLTLVVLNHKTITNNIKIFIISSCIGVLILFPYILSLRSSASLSRPKNVIVFLDSGVVSEVNQNREESRKAGGEVSNLFFSKPVAYSLTFISNYLSHFSPDFLFEKGDPVKIYSTPNSGILYLYEVVTLLLGAITLISHYKKEAKILISFLLIAPIAASLTKFVPSSSRLLFIAYPFAVISSVGFLQISKILRSRSVWIVAIVFVTIFFQARFLYSFFIVSPIRNARQWHYGVKDVMTYVSQNEIKYTKVWFSRKVWGYIYPLFYLKFPVQEYQQADHLGPLNEYGFGWVRDFGKFTLDAFPSNMMLTHSVLYIGEPNEFPSGIRPLKIVYYPDRSEAFYIADETSFYEN